jgi:hypothetical protein
MFNPLYGAAAGLLVMGALIHGGVGERLIVSRIPQESLPGTVFGGPGASKLMIRVTWHMVTLAFAAMATALALCAWGSAASPCTGVGRLVAGCFVGFLALGGARRDFRVLARHPGPLLFATVAVLAWFGSS